MRQWAQWSGDQGVCGLTDAEKWVQSPSSRSRVICEGRSVHLVMEYSEVSRLASASVRVLEAWHAADTIESRVFGARDSTAERSERQTELGSSMVY